MRKLLSWAKLASFSVACASGVAVAAAVPSTAQAQGGTAVKFCVVHKAMIKGERNVPWPHLPVFLMVVRPDNNLERVAKGSSDSSGCGIFYNQLAGVGHVVTAQQLDAPFSCDTWSILGNSQQSYASLPGQMYDVGTFEAESCELKVVRGGVTGAA